jgi:ABC-type antimicrobial peptide transport system permease subunit
MLLSLISLSVIMFPPHSTLCAHLIALFVLFRVFVCVIINHVFGVPSHEQATKLIIKILAVLSDNIMRCDSIHKVYNETKII